MNQKSVRRALCRPAVLVAAPPGRMRDSLCFLLRSVLGIEVAALADDCAAVSEWAAEGRPALVLLDGDLPGEGACAVVARLAVRRLCQCIVLATCEQQRREALSAGADGALLKGYTAMELWALLDSLGGAAHEYPTEMPTLARSLCSGRAQDTERKGATETNSTTGSTTRVDPLHNP